ncbi:peptidase S8/S53 domain-containing protein [Chaetomium sp. MPI-SDFR-AT-0129]|nr:peptidase S8/S53 domain-containing protein [Chaetomium sp. MPI-SDFR-AT-0129]
MAPIAKCLGLTFLLASVVSGRVMDRLHATPKGWVQSREATPDEPIFLRIALKQQSDRVTALDKAVLDIATPGHPNYGMHMTRDELRSYTAPSQKSLTTVIEWIRDYVVKYHVENDWISFHTTVERASELLNTRFSWYQLAQGGGEPVLRSLSYSVPDHVAGHIDLIQPTTRFANLNAQKSSIFDILPIASSDEIGGPGNKANFAANPPDDDPDSCASTITPGCLRKLYNIHYKPTDACDNKVAFASFLEEYARYDDLAAFEERLVPDAIGLNISVELVNGGLDTQDSESDSFEANLDAQYILGLAHPIPVVEYSVGGRGPLVATQTQPNPPGSNEPYLEFLLYMASLQDADLPQTISTSYGEEEQSVPRDYAIKVCDMFKELGARGVSIIFASGDSGPGNVCIRNTDNQTYFEPIFPAACPWVTSVGGTTDPSDEHGTTFSSGGFSIYHEQPVWQKDAVGKYLDTIGDAYSPYFNRSGRGFPDVSAQSNRFVICNRAFFSGIGGTSAASPVIAGIVALLNAARKAQDQPPLGFLNPWLYNNSAAFKDITIGSSYGCMAREEIGNYGAKWNTTEGWDPVTGLGTPLFDKLLEAAAPGTKNA